MRAYVRAAYHSVLLLVLCLFSAGALAETMYVTDQLRLGMYENTGGSGQRVQLLSSGMALQVLSRDGGFVQVTSQAGKTGWVKGAFLVKDKPAVLLLEEATAQRDALNTKTEALQLSTEQAVSEAQSAQTQLAAVQQEAQDLREQVKALTGEDRSPLQTLLDTPVLLLWFALLSGALFLGGGYLGYAIYDRKIRKRFYGLRIDTP